MNFVLPTDPLDHPANDHCHAAYVAALERAHEDLLVVLQYLTERTLQQPLESELIAQAAMLAAKPADALTPRERTQVWLCLDQFSSKLAPATVEGLRLTGMGRREEHVPWLMSWGVIGLLIATLILQGYAMFGGQTIVRIDALSRESQEVIDQINKMEVAQPELRQLGQDSINARVMRREPMQVLAEKAGVGPAAQTAPADVTYAQLWSRLEAINTAKRFAYHTLYQWNGVWGWMPPVLSREEALFFWGCECTRRSQCGCEALTEAIRPPTRDVQVLYGSEQMARALINDLQTLILPALYSTLGACAWLLRFRLEQIKTRRLRQPQRGEYIQHILLSSVLGDVVGVFYESENLRSQLQLIPLLGLAFLVGYNVEVVFALLDKLTNWLRCRLAGNEANNPPPADQGFAVVEIPPPPPHRPGGARPAPRNWVAPAE